MLTVGDRKIKLKIQGKKGEKAALAAHSLSPPGGQQQEEHDWFCVRWGRHVFEHCCFRVYFYDQVFSP